MAPKPERPIIGSILGTLVVLSVIVMIAACVFADNDGPSARIAKGSCGSGTTWVLEGDGTLVISGSGAMDDYTTPDDQPWGDYRVSITGISVSENVTSIGDHAFQQCGHAASVSIPSTVTSIGKGAFSYCICIESITLPEGLTSIGDSAFMYSGIKTITVPDKVASIENRTFMYCIGLTSATVPDSVTRIGAEAFLGCINLTELYVSSRLTGVAADAFYDVDLYDSDGVTPIVKDAEHLRGQLFLKEGGKAVRFATDLDTTGDVCSKTSDTGSATLNADDIAYLKKRAESNQNLRMKFILNDGTEATLDRDAIVSLGDADITMTIVPVDKSTLDESVKELVGEFPVYRISFGDYNELGNGKVTVTVPFALSHEKFANERVLFIKDDGTTVTGECVYKNGKVTFDTDTFSLFCIEYDEPSEGGSFPIWVSLVAVIGVIAIAAGVTLLIRNKKK